MKRNWIIVLLVALFGELSSQDGDIYLENVVIMSIISEQMDKKESIPEMEIYFTGDRYLGPEPGRRLMALHRMLVRGCVTEYLHGLVVILSQYGQETLEMIIAELSDRADFDEIISMKFNFPTYKGDNVDWVELDLISYLKQWRSTKN